MPIAAATSSPSLPTADEPRFREVELVRDTDGVVAVITERVADGRVSFLLAREYEQDGQTRRSAYLARRHIAGARRLLDDLEERLEQVEDRTRAARRAR